MPVSEEKVLEKCLISTGSTWTTPEILSRYLKDKEGHVNDIMNQVGKGNIICYKDFISLKKYAEWENEIVKNLMRIQFVKPSKKVPEKIIKEILKRFEVEENEGRKLHFNQINAVCMVVNHNISVLTGGPGTGKTTVLSAISYVLRSLHEEIKISFTAPTGKAARRVAESTGEMACTLHKQLGISFSCTKPRKFVLDALFIDEASMNDTELSAKLFSAVLDGRKVVFVGDMDQLPSVGPGAVLRDMIESSVIPVTMLTHTFRQDNDSVYYKNICNIRNGIPEFVNGDDFHTFLLPEGDREEDATKLLCEEIQKYVEKYGKENVVALIPYRKNGMCSNKVNNLLQKILNPEKCSFSYTNKADKNHILFKKGDFVMQLENRKECANGDVGQISEVSKEGVTVEFLDTAVHYSVENMSQLALAYAMTIHKCQGSEYNAVVMVLLDNHKKMLNRNLLYTGITRGKKECSVIYQMDALKEALKTKAESTRITMLVPKLREIRAQYKMVYGL